MGRLSWIIQVDSFQSHKPLKTGTFLTENRRSESEGEVWETWSMRKTWLAIVGSKDGRRGPWDKEYRQSLERVENHPSLISSEEPGASVLYWNWDLPTTWMSIEADSAPGSPQINEALLTSWFQPCENLNRGPGWAILCLDFLPTEMRP